MSKTIVLKKATRIEGNADIHIEVENGRAKTTRFMVQDFRGFEKFMQGKRVEFAPHLVSRICGLCCTAHQVAGFKAVENALGVTPTDSVEKLRKVTVLGEWISSHALSYFFLSSPDKVKGVRGIFDLMKKYPEAGEKAFALRKFGNRIVEILGKRSVHPVAMGVCGFSQLPTAKDLTEIKSIANKIKKITFELIESVGSKLHNQKQIPFPTDHKVNFLTFDDQPGEEAFYIFDKYGNIVESFDKESFESNISELRVDWSLAKFPYITHMGFPDGILMVGPLSRLHLKYGIGSDSELNQLPLYGQFADPEKVHLTHLDSCRLLEIFFAAKQILELLPQVDINQLGIPDLDITANGYGIGVVEAPRGVLIHNYLINNGKIERIRLLVATQFNNAYINLILQDLVAQHVNAEGNGLTEIGEELAGHCIRMFDPCLTCATH